MRCEQVLSHLPAVTSSADYTPEREHLSVIIGRDQ